MVGLGSSGKVVLRRKLRRESVISLASSLPTCVVAMEACCAHHMAGRLPGKATRSRLMSPKYVRPYVKAQKNDNRDAEAIAEAATRPTMRFVELKLEEQLDMQMLHRTRDRLVAERTSLTNQLRGFLLERGITAPQRRRGLEERLDALAADETSPISPRARLLVDEMRARWAELDRRITALDDEFAEAARSNDATRRLATIPGIGVMNATALVAAVGDARTFGRGRDLAAWLGRCPGR